MDKTEFVDFDEGDSSGDTELLAQSFVGTKVSDWQFLQAIKKVGTVLLQKSQTPTTKQKKK